jgi:hypothetical protein
MALACDWTVFFQLLQQDTFLLRVQEKKKNQSSHLDHLDKQCLAPNANGHLVYLGSA